MCVFGCICCYGVRCLVIGWDLLSSSSSSLSPFSHPFLSHPPPSAPSVKLSIARGCSFTNIVCKYALVSALGRSVSSMPLFSLTHNDEHDVHHHLVSCLYLDSSHSLILTSSFTYVLSLHESRPSHTQGERGVCVATATDPPLITH